MSSHQLNFKTNDLVLLLNTIWRYWDCFLSSVATDGMDGNGLKFEKNWPFFSIFEVTCFKNAQELYYGWPSQIKFVQKPFVYDLSLKVMILAQNWPKTAKSPWHCSFKGTWFKWLYSFFAVYKKMSKIGLSHNTTIVASFHKKYKWWK